LADTVEQDKLAALEGPAGAASDGLASTGVAQRVEPATPPGRRVVAVLWFEDKTHDPQMAHWRYAVAGLLTAQLRQVKAIRLLPVGAVDYAFRQLEISKGDAVDSTQARTMGEFIEAQRVVWGSYRRQADKWQVHAHVLNVASEKVSAELIAAAEDWFDLGEELAGQILNELRIRPSEDERQKMKRRWTDSPAAYEFYSQAFAMQDEGKPISQQQEAVRKAIAADPEFARAHLALASTLGSQGKFPQAEQSVRQALELKSDCADAHLVLGITLLFQKRPEEAEQALREAHRLDPDNAEPLVRLGELYGLKQNVDEAIRCLREAELLDPTNAAVHASLGWMYARKRDKDRAIVQLKQAESLQPDGLERINAEQMICQTYEMMGEIPLAVEHYEGFVTLARQKGLNPQVVARFEEKAQQLKATLTPTFIQVSMPKVYTEQTLQAALIDRLTKKELEMVTNPVASSPEIKRWAQQLTEGLTNDVEKAKALFEGLTRRIEPGGGRGKRTAQEVFAAWSNTEESFSCQEYAKLYLALARDVGLQAFYVHLEKDYRGKVVFHDCAAVFAEGKALLVDPAYRWFGVPHKEFVILDDVQTIAHHFFQHRRSARSVSRCRLAAKLHPDFAWGQVALASVLRAAKKPQEARKVLEVAQRLEPDRWDTYLLQGILAADDDNFDAAAGYLRKALELNPESAACHHSLAAVLLAQGKVEEAREQYRACLRYKPEPEMAENARRAVAKINELIGLEQDSGPEDAGGYSIRGAARHEKGLYDLAISDFTRAIEMAPGSVEAYVNRAAAYIGKRDYDRAIADCNSALEIDLQYADAYVNRGSAYAAKREHDLAILDLNKALELNPRDAGAYFNRALAYARNENHDLAISDWSKAIELNPQYAAAYSCRAEAYNKKEEYDRAISDCDKALEIDPDLAAAYRTRGFARKATGDFDGAISDLNKFQELSK